MSSLSEFLRMGGHGVYVWSAYGLSLLVLVATALISRRHEQRLLRKLEQRTSRK